jgi:polyisoprenoid-binding protein YceI
MRRFSLMIAITMSLTGCADLAHTVFPVNSEAAKAKPGDYSLDPDHAKVVFAVGHLGFSTFYGTLAVAEGNLHLDRDAPEASTVAVVMKTASLESGNAELNKSLMASGMFDAEKFPEIGFVSTSVTVTDASHAEVTGDLTLKGITKPVTLTVTFIGSGVTPTSGKETVGFEATGKIDRHDFSLDRWRGFVGDEVSLTMSAEFKR